MNRAKLYDAVARWDLHIGHVLKFRKAPPGRLVRVHADFDRECIIVWTEGKPFPHRHYEEDALECSCEKKETLQ
jgi:hypothetical protein